MSDLVELHSEEGQALLATCQGGYLQPLLHAVFQKQVGKSNCGIQSAAMVMSSERIGRELVEPAVKLVEPIPKEKQPIIEEDMFTFSETSSVASAKEVNTNGTTLEQVASILNNHGYDAKAYYANAVSVEKFREDAKNALARNNSSVGLIVNYHMATLGQTPPFGHHSPLAAYHPESDRFLIMDTWGDTKESWASVSQLHKAMNTLDEAAQKYRGYIVVQKKN